MGIVNTRATHVLSKANAFALLLAVLALLSLPGCRNPFGARDTDEGEPTRTGILSLTIGRQGLGRTIMPEIWPLNDIVRFEFEAVSPSGNEELVILTRDPSEPWLDDPGMTEIKLDAGTWNLFVTAFVAVGGGGANAVARGSLENIVVLSGETVTGNVVLFPVTYAGGRGTFYWNIYFPVDVARARMEIWQADADIENDPFLYDFYLFCDDGTPYYNSHSHYLDVGRYLVVFTLYSAQGSSVEVSAILHIYQNMKSRFTGGEVFPGFVFPRSLLCYILDAWNVVNEEWDFVGHGITVGHFGLLGIEGVNAVNFGDIVGRFDYLSCNNYLPGDLEELKALVDAALIGINMDTIVDIITGGVYTDRAAKEAAILVLPWFVRNASHDYLTFYPEGASTTITAVRVGDYTVTINLAGDITWGAMAYGIPYTTAINLIFTSPVEGLAMGDITVTGVTGDVNVESVTGGEQSWSLAISVTTPGIVSVSITRPGIAGDPQTLMVTGHVPPIPQITWTATAVNAPYTTAIEFTFASPVVNLSQANITVAPRSGAVMTGILTGSGTSWTLPVTNVVRSGNVSVSIMSPGISSGPVTVEQILGHVPPPPPITWGAVAYGVPYTTAINFVFASPIPANGLAAGDINVAGIAGEGAVVTGDLTGSGQSWSLAITSITTPGDVSVSIARSGIATGPQTVTVFDEQAPVPDIPWVAIAYGTPYTTAINFTFGAPVDDLSLSDDITIGGGPGVVTPGTLAGSGAFWTLPVTVTTPGEITVSIARPGIAIATQPLTVTVPPIPPITWIATASGTPRTTAIGFVFNEPVTGLVAGYITITNGTGMVERGVLTGSGTSWSLAVTTITAGSVMVSINMPGVESGARLVHVSRPVITWDAEASGTPRTTAIGFVFNEPVTGLLPAHITVTNGTGVVERGGLTGGGTSWTLAVTTTMAGSVVVSIDMPGVQSGPQPVLVYRPAITWSLTPIPAADQPTTAIGFNFDEPITGLTESNIVLLPGTGSAIMGNFTYGGPPWELSVDVVSSGTISVSIIRPGIASGPQTVTVTRAPIDWTATARGTPTTAIDFEFVAPVSGLTVDNIEVTGGVTTGALTGNGTFWSLAVTAVTSTGDITVSIIRPGIASGPQPVTVTRVPIDWNAFARGTPSTTAIDFVFDVPVSGLTQNNITITGGSGVVTTGTLTGGGTLWTLLVTVTTPGSISISIDHPEILDEPRPVTVTRPITWTAAVHNNPDTGPDTETIAIDFTFSATVEGLEFGEVTVFDGTGEVTRDHMELLEDLYGNGIRWRVPVTTEIAGTVVVAIDRSGVESNPTQITVSKPPIPWNATAIGNPTSAIEFYFPTAPITMELVPNNFRFPTEGRTGSVTWGSLTGGGRTWIIEVVGVTTPGNIPIQVFRDGIVGTTHSVVVTAEPFPPLAPVRTRVGAGRTHTISIGSLDRLSAWGSKPSIWSNPAPSILSPGSINNLVSISAGDSHTMAVRENGALYAWGDNTHGQLGPGGNRHSLTQVVWPAGELAAAGLESNTGWGSVFAGGNHTVAIRADGSLWAWGNNIQGQLGDGSTLDRNTPRRVQPPGAPDMRWALASLYDDHTLAIGEDGTLWAWGANWNHQLGSGTQDNVLTPVRIMSCTYWRYVSTGFQHTFAIRRDGSLMGWGSNYVGEIGIPGTPHPTPIEIGDATIDWAHVATGRQYTVAIRADGSLWAWGNNFDGQLGDGTNDARASPVRIGTAYDWAYVFVGENHTVAVRENGSVWTWGNNASGQLGRTTLPSDAPGQVTLP